MPRRVRHLAIRTFPKYSIVKAKRVHNTLEIAEGEVMVVSSCKSSREMFTVFGKDARLSKANFEVISGPFQVGDTVMCLDPTSTLTKGKEYKTFQSVFSGEVVVVNDHDVPVNVKRCRFAPEFK